MYQPKFTYTSSIVVKIGLIERLYANLKLEKIIPSISLKLTQENQALATHHSTSIEGNPLTAQEVTNIILGETVPTTKSEVEVKNYFNALNYISVITKENKQLSLDLIKKLHRLTINHEKAKQPGKLRDSMVIVGHRNLNGIVVKHNPPAHSAKNIAKFLENIFNYLNLPTDISPLILAGILHHEIVYIHPFLDGNGRIARLLTSYYMLVKGYEVTKYFILDDYYDIDRLEYSDKLHSADNEDKTIWLDYFLEGIVNSLQAAQSRVDSLMDENLEMIKGEKNRIFVTPREEDVLQLIINLKNIKTSDIVNRLKITRQQAQFLLKKLVDKSIIQKIGITKSSYYNLKT